MAKGKYQQWLEPEGLIKIGGWARDGLTDEQISDKIGISRSTLGEWKKKHSVISDTLKRGKEVADRKVEDALFKAAIGYEVHDITKERRFNKITGKFEMVVVKEVIRQVPPNVTAMIFWLKNRKPDTWRDKQNVEVKGTINNPFEGLTTDELKKLIADE